MSASAKSPAPQEPPLEWARLARASEAVTGSLRSWRHRAQTAEAEVERLLGALEAVAAGPPAAEDAAGEVVRLSAENAALRSRMAQAAERVGVLLARLDMRGARR